MRIFSLIVFSALLTLAPGHEAFARGSSHHSSSTRYSTPSTHVKSTVPVHVNGYTKKNGTYVAPHYRSHPDKSYNNNWSVKGNVNPYTGKPGTKNPTPDDKPPVKTPPPPAI